MLGRRTFISQAAMSVVSAAQGGGPGELAALARGTTWLNSPPLTAAALHRRIVLVNFCTYTCINWIRTLPFLRAWSKAYQNEMVIVGVHTPEFGFEHDAGNVRRALERLDVPYPIVLDNDYRIWRAFRNNYWPALYGIDAKGHVRNHQFGEGDYDRWEMFLQRMIAEAGGRGLRSGAPIVSSSGVDAAADWGNPAKSRDLCWLRAHGEFCVS